MKCFNLYFLAREQSRIFMKITILLSEQWDRSKLLETLLYHLVQIWEISISFYLNKLHRADPLVDVYEIYFCKYKSYETIINESVSFVLLCFHDKVINHSDK